MTRKSLLFGDPMDQYFEEPARRTESRTWGLLQDVTKWDGSGQDARRWQGKNEAKTGNKRRDLHGFDGP